MANGKGKVQVEVEVGEGQSTLTFGGAKIEVSADGKKCTSSEYFGQSC